jgi:hypothetical protein
MGRAFSRIEEVAGSAGGGFITACEPPRILLRAGINPAPTSNPGLSANMHIAKLDISLFTDISGTPHSLRFVFKLLRICWDVKAALIFWLLIDIYYL